MFVNLVVWFALAVLAVFLGWVVTRAWRARRWYVRWPAVILASLLTLLSLAILAVGANGLYKVYVPTGSPAPEIHVERTPEMIARGEHLADAFCTSCHSTTGDIPLVGGLDLSEDIPIPMGSFVSANLTPAGPLKEWSDGDIWRALRNGVGPDGRRLMVMGLTYTRYMSDEDLKAMIAFLRSQPAVENDTQRPADQHNFLGILVTGAGIIPEMPPVTEPIVAPKKAATAEYGAYILGYQDCRSCHGEDLLGGEGPFGPNATSLRIVRGLSQDEFISMMRTGKRSDGSELQPPMPWKAIGRMDDEELSAMYQYLINIQ